MTTKFRKSPNLGAYTALQELHDAIKARAEALGVKASDVVQEALRASLACPTCGSLKTVPLCADGKPVTGYFSCVECDTSYGRNRLDVEPV